MRSFHGLGDSGRLWLVEATGQKPLKVGKTGALMMWHKNGYLDCSGSHLTVG